MPSCPWCGTRRSCPDCKKAAALRGGAAAPAPTHPPQGTEVAPESTATDPTTNEVPTSAKLVDGDKATGTPRRRKPRLEGHDHPPPPSAGAYSAGCREPECRAANTAYRRERRRARGAQARQYRGLTHGRASSYNRGCKCELCRAAHAEALRRYRAAKRGRMGK